MVLIHTKYNYQGSETITIKNCDCLIDWIFGKEFFPGVRGNNILVAFSNQLMDHSRLLNLYGALSLTQFFNAIQRSIELIL